MDRRSLLQKAGGLAFVGGISGCSGLISSGDNPGTVTPTTTAEPEPQASWSEEWIRDSNYRVTVDVQLDGAEEAEVRMGTAQGSTVASISENGTHTVAGPATEYGSVEAGVFLHLVRFRESGFDELSNWVTADSFLVGSKVQATVPLFLRGISGSSDPDLSDSGTISRTYEQSAPDGMAPLTLDVPEILYSYYGSRDRTRNYGAYVSDTYDDPYLSGVVSDFESYGQDRGMNDVEIIDHMMAFVQDLEYTSDQVSAGFNEYPKYPVETLVDQGGDCEDTCILLASLLESFGYGSVLLAFYDEQHMALGVAGEEAVTGTSYQHNGRDYYYVETTAPDWGVGMVPDNIKGASPEILTVIDHAVLVCSYAVDVTGYGADVDLSMMNVGMAAGEARARFEFEDRSGNVTASGETETVTLQPNEETSKTMDLMPPEEEQRAKVTLYADGEKQDTLTSEFREPVETG